MQPGLSKRYILTEDCRFAPIDPQQLSLFSWGCFIYAVQPVYLGSWVYDCGGKVDLNPSRYFHFLAWLGMPWSYVCLYKYIRCYKMLLAMIITLSIHLLHRHFQDLLHHQLPGTFERADVTEVLARRTFWPSYNSPYFPGTTLIFPRYHLP